MSCSIPSHLDLGTSSGLLPILRKLSEWVDEEELEDFTSTIPVEGSLSSECCALLQSTACGDDAQLFLLRDRGRGREKLLFHVLQLGSLSTTGWSLAQQRQALVSTEPALLPPKEP